MLGQESEAQRKGLQAPFETGDYNGVSEELQNLHGPNANRNIAKSAVLQVRRVQAISGYMEREGNDPIEETAGFVAELSAQYGCEACSGTSLVGTLHGVPNRKCGWPNWGRKSRERLGKPGGNGPRPMSGEQTAEASPSERSAHIGQ